MNNGIDTGSLLLFESMPIVLCVSTVNGELFTWSEMSVNGREGSSQCFPKASNGKDTSSAKVSYAEPIPEGSPQPKPGIRWEQQERLLQTHCRPWPGIQQWVELIRFQHSPQHSDRQQTRRGSMKLSAGIIPRHGNAIIDQEKTCKHKKTH